MMETDLSKMSKEDREDILAGFTDETIPVYAIVILTLRGMAGNLIVAGDLIGAQALFQAAETFEVAVDTVTKYKKEHGSE